MKLVTYLVKVLLYPFRGKLKYQATFENLLKYILYSMNIGSGAGFHKSGELTQLNFIYRTLKPGKVIAFDVGANIGGYAISLSNHLPSDALIYSFEPSKETFNILKENTKHISSIIPLNIGLGSTNERVDLYSDSKESTLASIYQRNLSHFNLELNQREVVEIRTIDSIMEEFNLDHIDFLKIDVEGNELNVLKGASHSINKDLIYRIQFEMGGTNIDARTYFQDFFYLLHKKFNIYRIVKDGIFEIKEYSELYEVFLPTNFYAELKFRA